MAPDGREFWHSLVAHGIDVAATLEALCEASTIRLRLQAAAERTLSRTDIARLGVLACFHDFGKADRGFWGRQFDVGDPRRGRDAGHIAETSAALYGAAAERAHAALGFERMAEWGGALEALIVATLSHHGSPVASRIRKDVVSPADLALWSAAGSYDPMRELERLREAAFAMFPEAFAGGPPVPDKPRFVHLFAGLLMLADWIGSDPTSFPLGNGDDADRIAFARGRAPALLADFGIVGLHERPRTAACGFEGLFGWPPRALQEALGAIDDEPLVILEAETGSGKTEAALWHFAGLLGAGLVDGLYFALPTRVAAVEMWADERRGRLAVARRMYALRLGEVLPHRDVAVLRGIEGARAKALYRLLAERHGVAWHGRRYDRSDPQGADLPNQAINHAASAVEGAAAIAVAATGTIPQLGFVHEDSGQSFVLDVADLFRDSVTVPQAFRAVGLLKKRPLEGIERLTRRLVGEALRRDGVIAATIDRIKVLLEEPEGAAQAGPGKAKPAPEGDELATLRRQAAEQAAAAGVPPEAGEDGEPPEVGEDAGCP